MNIFFIFHKAFSGLCMKNNFSIEYVNRKNFCKEKNLWKIENAIRSKNCYSWKIQRKLCRRYIMPVLVLLWKTVQRWRNFYLGLIRQPLNRLVHRSSTILLDPSVILKNCHGLGRQRRAGMQSYDLFLWNFKGLKITLNSFFQFPISLSAIFLLFPDAWVRRNGNRDDFFFN